MIPESEPDDPVNWSARLLIGIALAGILPQLVFLILGWNVLVPIWGVAGFGFWILLYRRSKYAGFPFLFDFLAMQVFLWSVAFSIIAVLNMVRAELLLRKGRDNARISLQPKIERCQHLVQS